MAGRRIGGYVEYRPRSFLRALVRWAAFWAVVTGTVCLTIRLAGCRATVPVVQVNSTMTCTVTGGDETTGTVRMDCRQNGHKVDVPVTAPGDGPTTNVERKTSLISPPLDARLN